MLALVPMEGIILVLAVLMIFGGLWIEFGIGWAMIGAGAVLLLMEAGPTFMAMMARRQ